VVGCTKNRAAAICGLLVILAVFFCCPTRSSCADRSSTRELLSELPRFSLNSTRLEACRRELLERDDLLPTISQRIEQGQADPQEMWLLQHLPFERVEPVVRKAIDSKGQIVRSAACGLLGQIGDARGVPILETRLARYLSKRDHHMITMGHIEDQEAVDALNALVEIKGAASDRVLANALGQTSPILSFRIAKELAHRGRESAVPALIGLLDCREPTDSSSFYTPIAQEAGRALQQLTYVYATSVYGVFSPPTELQSHIRAEILGRSGRNELSKKQISIEELWQASWQAWWESHKKQNRSQWRKESFAWSENAIGQRKTCDQAINGLLLIGDKPAIDRLFAFVNDPKTPRGAQAMAVQDMWFNDNLLLEEPLRQVLVHHPSGNVRSAAAYALNQFRSKASGEALVRALADRDAMSQAIGSLRFYPYKECLSSVLPFLQNADADVRDSARIAVDAIRSNPSEAVLLERLRKQASLRGVIAILDALRWSGTEKSLPQLVNLLRHHNSRVRKATVQAIEEIAKIKFDHSEGDDVDIETRTAIEQWWAGQRREKDNTQLPNT
jgi:HEAT repeat protein